MRTQEEIDRKGMIVANQMKKSYHMERRYWLTDQAKKQRKREKEQEIQTSSNDILF